MKAKPSVPTWSTMPTRRNAWRICFGTTLSAFVLFPALISDHIPLRPIAILLGLVAVVSETWLCQAARKRRLGWSFALTIAVGVAVALIEVIARQLGDRMFAVNAEHLFVLLPLYGAFGALAMRATALRSYALTFLSVAAVAAALAIAESLLGSSLLGRDAQFMASQREGPIRALVGAEHVLVLGALLATATTFTPVLRSWRLRLPLTLLLLFGCWATGSRAAAFASTCVVVIQAIPRLVEVMQRLWWVIASSISAGFVALAFLATWVWTTEIPGQSGVTYSANYRFASYAVVADVLEARPFGYLLQAPPENVWVMDSELRGAVDLVHSSDSELVFAVFAAGWLGVVCYLLAFWLGSYALRTHPVVGMSTLTLTGLGLIMSLHGWDAASMLWYLLIGACVYSLVSAMRASAAVTDTDQSLSPNLEGTSQ